MIVLSKWSVMQFVCFAKTYIEKISDFIVIK